MSDLHEVIVSAPQERISENKSLYIADLGRCSVTLCCILLGKEKKPIVPSSEPCSVRSKARSYVRSVRNAPVPTDRAAELSPTRCTSVP